jgi:hypothetical protein
MNNRPFSFIHVGFTNTGTTSLQLNFFSRRTDIFYAGEPYHERGGIFSNLRYVEDFKYDEPYISLACHEQIFTRNEGKIVVVSDETLCDSPQLYFAPYILPRDVIALRLFRLFQPAKIIFTIRSQEEYVSSMYLNVKRNFAFLSRMPVPPLTRWYRGMLSQLRCHYLQNLNFYEVITVYEQIFGRENILVLPLEQLIVDGPRSYLQTLCDFLGLGLSDEDIDYYRKPRNVQNMAGELLTDDRFFTIYSAFEQEFGRERVQDFLDQGGRAIAVLDDEDRADLRSRVASGNWLLAERYDLDLKRYGYAMAAPSIASDKTAGSKTISSAWRFSNSHTDQLLAIIDTEREAKARQIAEMQRVFAAEREAAVGRIRELEATLKAERDAFVARIHELETTLRAEHDAFVARIRELEGNLDGERHAQANQIAEMQRTFAAEREAATARIQELEQELSRSARRTLARILDVVAKRGR